MNWSTLLASILSKIDITEILKDKRLRWSAKRTVGALIALTACNDIQNNGITWQNVVLCFIAVLPLCLSLLELDKPETLFEKAKKIKERRKLRKSETP